MTDGNAYLKKKIRAKITVFTVHSSLNGNARVAALGAFYTWSPVFKFLMNSQSHTSVIISSG